MDRDNTTVLRLGVAKWFAYRYRRLSGQFLNEIAKGIKNGGYWAPKIPGPSYPWDPWDVIQLAVWCYESDYNGIEFYSQDRIGGPFIRRHNNQFQGLLNNMEASVLGQHGARRSGLWIANDGKLTDRRRIRL